MSKTNTMNQISKLIKQYLLLSSVLLISTNAITVSTLAATTPDLSGILSGRKRSEIQIQREQRRLVNGDYARAWNLANSAISQCYGQKNLNECSRLTQIKDTLATWCNQNDLNACAIYKNIVGAEGLAMGAQTLDDISNIR
jgi:hypothetical protein